MGEEMNARVLEDSDKVRSLTKSMSELDQKLMFKLRSD